MTSVELTSREHYESGDPVMAMSSPLYGQINTTRSPMRELQIGVKFAF